MSVLGALSDLPVDDSRILVEFTAIKDTVLEISKVASIDAESTPWITFAKSDGRANSQTFSLRAQIVTCIGPC